MGASMGTTTGGDDPVRLATFERRNRDTGSVEEIRLEVSEFQGRSVISARIWYRSRGGPAGPDDDGWRPSKAGFTVREHELPIWTGALERARAMLSERPGRNTRE